VPELTLFLHARQVLNSNAMARKQLINFSDQIGSDFRAYEMLTKNIECHSSYTHLYSTISIKIISKHLKISVGFSPW
jgi:hypothetical protein